VPPDRAQGVFETMLVSSGRVHALEQHLERLTHSLAALYGTRLPAGLHRRVTDQAAGLTGEHRLRVDAIPGQEIAVTTRPVAAGYRQPVTLEPLVIPGGLGPHKWRDRCQLDIAQPDIAPRYRGTISVHEVTPLIVDADHTVLEAAWGNVWLLDGDRLITPPADGRILPGVTRALLLERAAALGLTPREAPISLQALRAAPVTFATSSIRLAVPATLAGCAAAPAAPIDRIRAALS
jgi:para-aminobenzoate synthetase / 4-amino-4-deoxychorismate lyase